MTDLSLAHPHLTIQTTGLTEFKAAVEKHLSRLGHGRHALLSW